MENQEVLQAILSEIREIKADVSDLKADMVEVKAEQHRQGEEITGMKQEITGMKQEITKINIRLENDVDKKINLLLEGQQGMNEKFEKLDRVAADVEEIRLTTRALEAVTQRNSNDIRNLRAVK